ncbi:AbrB/MazE/SpoVT family DNA-binding domain-containing protein [Paenibacillus sp. LMG 31456]|uniref:AbrB/MazE/SpoVT family DNA-binding domain-containing protein n=1 Tax=Paenibacillus foliorum TaxID=2654974 RepID=A0A972K379_9BACL|nr:AbrB/MazE/SpoVT family DNA-binding domain-containing protein [Paenibacillus foliorum]NOU95618.1 AbrB/MazE/SpoVT family DNA-binding domain-containing protein [Paenibacillus foliorum]
MKATGIVRQVDHLGRIVLPMELRKTMDINTKDSLEIFTDGQQIVLRKYAPGCTLCGSVEQLTSLYPGKLICTGCVKIIVNDAEKLTVHSV